MAHWQQQRRKRGALAWPCPVTYPETHGLLPLHHQTWLGAGYVSLPLAILLRAKEGVHSNVLPHFSSQFVKWEFKRAQPFRQLQSHRNVHALNLKAVCICYQGPLPKICSSTSCSTAVSSKKHGWQGAVTPAHFLQQWYMYADTALKAYYSFPHISKVWLKYRN